MKFELKAEISSTLDSNEKTITLLQIEAENLEEAFKEGAKQFDHPKYRVKWLDGKEMEK